MVQVLSNMTFQRSSFFSFKLKVREGEVVHLLCNSYVLSSISGPQISDYQDPTTDTHMRSCYSKSEMSWLCVNVFSFQVNISLYEYFASVFCLTETLFRV